MKKIYTIILSLLVASTILGLAQSTPSIPAGYYNAVSGLSDASLKNALYVLISKHNEVSSYNSLPTYFRKTDAYMKNGVQYWWDMYSDIPVRTDANFGTYMNREHSFPKSWWGGLTDTPAYVDLYHLYPAEKDANMKKSNFPLGEVSSATFDNGFVRVGYPVTGQGGNSSQVFEPNEEYRGDFARTYFYVVTCYQNLTWTSKYMYMLQQNTYPTLKPWAVDLLLKWAREDPVSQKEIDRNEEVYKVQNNRNPFIDFPDLCEYIWGDKKGYKFYPGQTAPSGDPTLIAPAKGSSLDFDQIALGMNEVQRLTFQGENLTGNLRLSISGTDKAMFSIESTSLSSSLVNIKVDDAGNVTGGTTIPITYKPTATGSHTAKLVIQGGGISGSRSIELIGECLPYPDLTAPVATAATNISSDGYTANWEVPAQVVDYYIVTRTKYINGTSSQEDILAEENFLDIDGFNASTSESYNVRSVRLGVASPRSNEIFVEHSGVQGVETDMPLGWAACPGGVIILCGVTHTNACIYDIAGRLVRMLPEVENNQVIELPYGAFIITTDQSSTPIRVLVN